MRVVPMNDQNVYSFGEKETDDKVININHITINYRSTPSILSSTSEYNCFSFSILSSVVSQ